MEAGILGFRASVPNIFLTMLGSQGVGMSPADLKAPYSGRKLLKLCTKGLDWIPSTDSVPEKTAMSTVIQKLSYLTLYF